jgi:hypothetical protein
MSSDVDIANLALSHLGDSATVATFNPPEGSPQAEHCARWYPIARDSLLEMHTWNFATKRVQLAEVATTFSQWRHAYAQPTDMLLAVALLDSTSPGDYGAAVSVYGQTYSLPNDSGPEFVCEVDEFSNSVIYTNQEAAVLRYISRVEDSGKFSPLFTLALSWHLAGMLAGPVLTGDVGIAESKRCAEMAAAWFARAVGADSRQRKVTLQHNPIWLGGR